MQKSELSTHFKELRNRILFVIIFFVISFLLCFLLSKDIYQILLKNLLINDIKIERLIFTAPGEIFFTYLKISFLSSIITTLPIFLIELYLFLSPGLYKNEKINILLIFLFSPLLFLIGALFAYFFIIPLALEFFLNFEVEKSLINNQIPIELEAKVSEFLSFSLRLLFGFGLAFELPIILLILMKFKIIKATQLASKRKYWILFIFTLAAILTPPDIISQISLALPMIILFEASLIIARFYYK